VVAGAEVEDGTARVAGAKADTVTTAAQGVGTIAGAPRTARVAGWEGSAAVWDDAGNSKNQVVPRPFRPGVGCPARAVGGQVVMDRPARGACLGALPEASDVW
jgi:hypothetical protein